MRNHAKVELGNLVIDMSAVIETHGLLKSKIDAYWSTEPVD